MKAKLLIANHALLFLCVSMYLGTGWSMLLFSFPIAPQLTPDNYYLQFVPQVAAATYFFTYMTIVMIICAVIMTISEWRTGRIWAPVVTLLGVIAATVLTMKLIFPYNDEMSQHISDPARLHLVLDRWMALNKLRVGIWSVQWLAMMAWFAGAAGRSGDAA